jgi:hypothetical protein
MTLLTLAPDRCCYESGWMCDLVDKGSSNGSRAIVRYRNGQRYRPGRRRGKVNNHRNEMAYRGDCVDALIKIYGARIESPDHDTRV